LSRTTRSVSTTEAGETLLRSLRPALEDIGNGLAKVGALGSAPSGTIRLTATKNAVMAILMPVMARFIAEHPGVTIETIVDDNLTDIVANRFDAGIRFGNIVEKDMIALRVGADMRRAVVGSPDYFKKNPPPKSPAELSNHACIAYRMVKSGGLYDWEFEENGRPFRVSVQGPLVFNDTDLMRQAAIAGMGLAYLYEDDAEDDIGAGRLVRILEGWCPLLPGYYLYHPSRRQTPPALAALIDVLRYRSPRS
jgi:DNA-binding transcriptional LysR family regulator